MISLKFLFFFFLPRELNVQTNLKFVHTSFHGVGHDYVQLAFKAFGFQPPIPVPEQKDPDPDFSTVKCPNPEEGESVLVFLFLLCQIYVFQWTFLCLDMILWWKTKKKPGITWLSAVLMQWALHMGFSFNCMLRIIKK